DYYCSSYTSISTFLF
nr:immunoglobulin light chain junction region [Macaca mulatta]